MSVIVVVNLCVLMCVSCLLQSQLGILEVELKDLICEKQRKVEETQNALREVQVSFQPDGSCFRSGPALRLWAHLTLSVLYA